MHTFCFESDVFQLASQISGDLVRPLDLPAKESLAVHEEAGEKSELHVTEEGNKYSASSSKKKGIMLRILWSFACANIARMV